MTPSKKKEGEDGDTSQLNKEGSKLSLKEKMLLGQNASSNSFLGSVGGQTASNLKALGDLAA